MTYSARPLALLAQRIRLRKARLNQLVERNLPARVLAFEADILLSLMSEHASRMQRLAAWTSPPAPSGRSD